MVEGIKYDEGLARFGGKKDRYNNMLLRFAKDLEGELATFSEAFSEDKRSETAAAIHTLKGVSGNLGIVRLYTAAVEFEKTLRSGEPDKELYETIINERRYARNSILKALSNSEEKNNVTEFGSNEEFNELAEKLLEGLENCEPHACEMVMKTLSQKRWYKIDSETIKKISHEISEYNFDSAEALLKARL